MADSREEFDRYVESLSEEERADLAARMDEAIEGLDAFLKAPLSPAEVRLDAEWDQILAAARDSPEVRARLIEMGFDPELWDEEAT